MTEVSSSNASNQQLQPSNEIPSPLMSSLQKLISTNDSEAAAFEGKFKNANKEARIIVDNISECVALLMTRASEKFRQVNGSSLLKEEYQKLEEVLQKHEADNRGYLGENLQNKLTIEQLKARVDQVEKEKQEAVNSIKQHLTQKNKEILSLHKDIEALKKAAEDLKNINDNQEFSIRQYEAQVQELPQLKSKCKQLQKELDGMQRGSSKKEGFKAINISLNLKKTLNSEIKHSSDTDLSKHVNTSASASNRNRSNIPGSTISTTLGTMQNNNNNNIMNNTSTTAKLVTPSKLDRKPGGQSHLLSTSSRGMASAYLDNNSNNLNTFLSYAQPTNQQLNQSSVVSQSQPNTINQFVQQPNSFNINNTNQNPNNSLSQYINGSNQQQLQQPLPNNHNNSSKFPYNSNLNPSAPYIDSNSGFNNKQPFIKGTREHLNSRQNSHNASLHSTNNNINNSSQSHNNSSQNIDTKDLNAYLNSGIIAVNNNNSSILNNSNNGINKQSFLQQQHKRSKSQQGSQLKGALGQQQSSILGMSARTNSSLNYRHRGLNSSHLSTSQEMIENNNNYQHLNKKDQFADTNLAAINASLPNPQISVHPFSSAKQNTSASNINSNNGSSNSNQNNLTSVSQQQMLQQLYVQSSGSRNGYGSSAKRISSRGSQNK